jgi:hypothetical protein
MPPTEVHDLEGVVAAHEMEHMLGEQRVDASRNDAVAQARPLLLGEPRLHRPIYVHGWLISITGGGAGGEWFWPVDTADVATERGS